MSHWQLYPCSVFDDFSGQWDQLNQQLYRSHPLLDSRFVGNLLKYFATPQTCLAVYPANTEHLSNMLLIQPGKAGVWQTFLPSQAQISPMLCRVPEALLKLPDALPKYTVAVDLLCQDPRYSFATSPLKNLDVIDHVTTINVAVKGDFADYWEQRSHNVRKNIRRYFNRLANNHFAFQLNIVTEADELPSALQRYGELESKSWKGEAGTAIHSQNAQGRFYRDVLQDFAMNRQAEIIELIVNGQVIASRINILNKDMLVILKTTYAEEFSEYAPGRLLLYLLIEREFSLKRVEHIEFYTNATTDQIAWATGTRIIQHVTLYSSAITQKIVNLYRTMKNLLSSFVVND